MLEVEYDLRAAVAADLELDVYALADAVAADLLDEV